MSPSAVTRVCGGEALETRDRGAGAGLKQQVVMTNHGTFPGEHDQNIYIMCVYLCV